MLVSVFKHGARFALLLSGLHSHIGVAIAQQTGPVIDTFDGGWRSGERSVECSFQGQSYRLEMTDGTARFALDGEYQPPSHIRYSPGSVLYIYGDDESGISGAAFDFVNNEMVRRDFVPGEGESHPYSDRIPCVEVR